MKTKLKVEIWSDIMCPFCYIGKRRFEKALARFDHKNDIEVEWKSFQLNPGLVTDPDTNIHDHLSKAKGWTLDYAKQANAYVTQMALEEGLHYDFDRAIVANSFDAHRLIQLAKSQGKGAEMEERLFKAYFTEGKNIADHETLAELGSKILPEPQLIREMLQTNKYAESVDKDIYESQQIGVQGVPFFVFNDRYAVSGAQPVETFLGALNKSWEEWNQAAGVTLLSQDGQSCEPGGDCH